MCGFGDKVPSNILSMMGQSLPIFLRLVEKTLDDRVDARY